MLPNAHRRLALARFGSHWSMAKNVATEKPTYLGPLNALAVAETAAAPLFDTWADTTKDKRLKKALRMVAMREREHGIAFAKRMLELGYEVRTPDDLDTSGVLKIAGSKKSDLAKFKALKFHKAPGGPDVFDAMFTDKNIDPVTGGLLGRYIAEERDTLRLLYAEYERLQKKAKAAKK